MNNELNLTRNELLHELYHVMQYDSCDYTALENYLDSLSNENLEKLYVTFYN
jgi:hypothetical protein